MTIREAWNWGMLIRPLVFLIFGYIGLILQGAWWIMSFLFFLLATYIVSEKCKCPECNYTFRGDGLSMGTLYYWPSDLKVKCKRCGQLLE